MEAVISSVQTEERENLDKAVYCILLNGEKLLEEPAPSRKRARLSDLI
jgi:hypothetical protein